MPKTSEPQTVFGRRLREARVRKGIAQDKLGVSIGIDEGCASARVSRYESGIHAPSFSIAEKLADVVGVPVAYLYCTDDRLAEVILVFGDLRKRERETLVSYVQSLAK